MSELNYSQPLGSQLSEYAAAGGPFNMAAMSANINPGYTPCSDNSRAPSMPPGPAVEQIMLLEKGIRIGLEELAALEAKLQGLLAPESTSPQQESEVKGPMAPLTSHLRDLNELQGNLVRGIKTLRERLEC